MPVFFRGLLVCQVVLFCALQVSLWSGDRSVPTLWRAKDQLAAYMENNAALEQRNRELFLEIESLKSGRALEERARFDLGMIKPEESFFVVVPSD